MNLLQKELGRVMRSEVNIIKQYIFILHVSCIILHSPIDRLQLPPPPSKCGICDVFSSKSA